MALTLKTAMDRVRRLILEKNAALHTASEVYDELSDAQVVVSRDLDCVVGLTSFAISDGKVTYTLPAGTQKIFYAWYVKGTSRYPMVVSDDVEANIILDEKQRTEGRPERLIRRGFTSCEFRPVPAETQTCELFRSYEPAAIALSGATFAVPDSVVISCVIPLAAKQLAFKAGDFDRADRLQRTVDEALKDTKKRMDWWNIKSKPLGQYGPELAGYASHPLASTLT